MIPKEIQDKIDEKYPSTQWSKTNFRNSYCRLAADFGYSLRDGEVEKIAEANLLAYNKIWNEKEDAIEKIKELEVEVERLKGVAQLAFTLDETQISWQQFKSANNI